MYVGKTYLAWADFVRFQGMSLMDGHLLRGKIQAWGSVQILVIHASTYCSMRKKQPQIAFDRFFLFLSLSALFFFDWNYDQKFCIFFTSFSGNKSPPLSWFKKRGHLLRGSQPGDKCSLGVFQSMRAAHSLLKTVLGGELRWQETGLHREAPILTAAQITTT